VPKDRTILIIEGDMINRKMTADLLAREGYGVLQARTGKAGIELAITEQPDLVMVNMSLSDMAGSDVVRSLTQSAETEDIPVVALMDRITPTACREAAATGCVGSMAKRYSFPYNYTAPYMILKALYDFISPSRVSPPQSMESSKLEKATDKGFRALSRAFVSLTGSYPSGAMVEMNDRSVCIVREQNKDFPDRPVVEMVMDKKGDHPDGIARIDLSDQERLSIRRIIGVNSASMLESKEGASCE
jgi:two-component system cell cycle response regulator DivK